MSGKAQKVQKHGTNVNQLERTAGTTESKVASSLTVVVLVNPTSDEWRVAASRTGVEHTS